MCEVTTGSVGSDYEETYGAVSPEDLCLGTFMVHRRGRKPQDLELKGGRPEVELRFGIIKSRKTCDTNIEANDQRV